MKIMIVDDSATDRKILKYTCERHGYQDIIEARDGQEGFEMAEQHKPDLIISDALMPRMDGFHFLRAIKAREDLKAIPFVFYSATYTGYNEAELARSLGAETFIAKPMEPEEFWNHLDAVLKKLGTGKAEPASSTMVEAEAEPEYLKEYSRIVASKLEEKVYELEDARMRMAQSEEFTRNILESVDEGVIVLNRTYDIVSANKGYANLVKLPVADIIGRHCYECSHHLQKPCFENGEECVVKRTFETGLPSTAVHKHTDSAGAFLYIETRSFPMKVESGSVSLVIEVCADVTEKKRLEDQLRQAQKMEAIGQLAGGVAHDFNNILTAIIGYSNIVHMKMKADDPLRMHIGQVLEAANRAAALTQSLLAFSRKQIMNPKLVDLNQIIARVEKFLHRIIGEDVELKTNLTREAVTVNADSGQIEQVLMNLATNARDAMPKGGVFTIETGAVAIDDEFIRMHGFGEHGMYARITASDTGGGMDEATRKRIFEPFFTTKELGRGTGLGLSIVYGIIRQHHGVINVYSEPGRGTTFKVYLPIASSPAEERHAEHEDSAPQTGTETILLAEDDEVVMELSCTVLRDAGYTVITAVNGEEAMRQFLENRDRIRLILLDMIMPKKTGGDVYQEIKKIQPDIKALFMSGYTADVVHIQRLLEEGVEVIQKPISPTALLKKIREALDKK